MSEKGYSSHTSASGKSLGERLKGFGCTFESYSYWKDQGET